MKLQLIESEFNIEKSFITPELLRRCVGLQSIAGRLKITAEEILRFSEAIGDSNPSWNSPLDKDPYLYAPMITPPTFLRSMKIAPIELPCDLPYKRGLDGGVEWEYFVPLHPGDQILGTRRILDLFERNGKIGPMLLIVSQITYTNQKDELVATQKNTTIRY